MRDSIFNFLYKLGALRFFKTGKNSSVILCFHRVHPIYDPITQPLSPEAFEQILINLKKYFVYRPLDDLLTENQPVKHACYITFDDALTDFYKFAFPILKKHEIPVTLFVPTESVEQKKELYNYELARIVNNTFKEKKILKLKGVILNQKSKMDYYLQIVSSVATSDKPEEVMMFLREQLNIKKASETFKPMTWQELSHVSSQGVNIGSHFHSHTWLNKKNKIEVEEDLQTSIDLIKKHINQKIRMVAYPMGAANLHVQNVINQKNLLGFNTEGISFNPNIRYNKSFIPRFNISDRSYQEILFRIGGFHKKIKL